MNGNGSVLHFPRKALVVRIAHKTAQVAYTSKNHSLTDSHTLFIRLGVRGVFPTDSISH